MTEEKVQVTYQLAQLPTPAYRAGLAGLIFLVQFLHRYKPETQEHIRVQFNSTSAIFNCTKEGLQELINLAFDSEYVLNWTEKKRSGGNLIKTEKTEAGKRYCYEDLKIKGLALQERDPSGIWTPLWAKFFLNAIRVKSRSQDSIRNRANEISVDLKKFWEVLKNPSKKSELSSAFLISSEGCTTEGHDFYSTNGQWFLLNFWPYVSQPYVPCRFDQNGKPEDWGYVVAIPDVQDLKAFIRTYPDILERRRLNPPKYPEFRPPLGSLIDLPEEAALDSLRLIRRYMEETNMASSFEYDVLGFEIGHIYPYTRPNGQRDADLISITYIQPDSDRDKRYALYRDKFWCPWFRRHLLQNLVKNRPWTSRWGELLSTASQKWFEDRFFPNDCKLVFNSEENIVETSELIQILKSLCDRYLSARLAAKGHSPNNWDEKHKLARQEFLAVRARPQKDTFRKYFYETLCSQVTPVLFKKGLSTEEYEALSKEERQQQAEQQNAEKIRQILLISEALDKDTETVRGLTMLALASNFQFAERSNSSV